MTPTSSVLLRPRVSQPAALFLGVLGGALLAVATGLTAAVRAESPPPLRAEQFLAAEELSGPTWIVETGVTTDGLIETYQVKSAYGTWPARGRVKVQARIRESQAMRQLEDVSKSEVFTDAVKNSVTAPIDLISSAAQAPVETVKAVPQSVGRWFKTTSFKVSETFNDVSTKTNGEDEGAKEGDAGDEDQNDASKDYANKFLKISSAERNWYGKLGVDPYTDNETLRAAVQSVAKVEGLTTFAMKFAPLPKIPGQGAIDATMDLVYKTDPWELRRRNREIMLGAGLSEDTARRFENNPALTPTAQTALIESLRALNGVDGRASIIARGIETESREQAELLVFSTLALRELHETGTPLAAILEGTHVPVARTSANELVAMAPSDAMFWTEELADAANEFAAAYAGVSAKARTLRVAGNVSDRARKGFDELGWRVASGSKS